MQLTQSVKELDINTDEYLFKNSEGFVTIHNGKEENIWPDEVFNLEKSWLFGFITFSVVSEDRKTPPDTYYQYKTQVNFKVGFAKYSFIFRTKYEPMVFKNGKELPKAHNQDD